MTTTVMKYSTRIRDKLPQHLDKVDKQAKKTDRSLMKVKKTSETIGTKTKTKTITKDIKSMGQAADRSSKGISSFTFALGSAFIAGTALFHLMRRSDVFVNMSNKLRLITQDHQDLIDTQQRLVDLAVTTRTDLDALVTTYQRVDKALARMGSSANDTAGVTEALALGIKTTGIASDEATAALRQITQAFNKGKLDGDEFRSVGENMPVVLDAIAKEAKISRAELMDWARQGKITSDLMQRGLLKALPQLREDFKKIKPTFGDSVTAMSAAWTDFVGAMTNSQTSLGKFFNWMIKMLGKITEKIQDFAKDFRDINKGANAREIIPIQERLISDRDMLQKVQSQPVKTVEDREFISDLKEQIAKDEQRIAALKGEYYGKGSRGSKPFDQITKGEIQLGDLEKRFTFLQEQRARGDITEEQFQKEARSVQQGVQRLPLSEEFAKAYNLEERAPLKPEATDKERKARKLVEDQDLRAYKATREGVAKLTDSLKKAIKPLDDTKDSVKDVTTELTEREKFEKKTIKAMSDINKQRVVIQTQQKLGAITDKEAAEALVQLGVKKKNLKAEYLAEIATNDKVKGSLNTLNAEFEKLGKKVDPAIAAAQAEVEKRNKEDAAKKAAEEQKKKDEAKAKSDAEKAEARRKEIVGMALGAGSQATSALLGEVGAGFMGESLGIDPATGKPREAEAGGGTAVASLDAGLSTLIESGDPIKALFAALGPIIKDVVKALSGLIPLFSKGLGKVFKAFNKLIPILADALAPILEGISPLLDAVAVIFDAVGNILKQTLVPTMKILGPILEIISKGIVFIIDGLIKWWNFWIDLIEAVTFGAVKFDKFKTSDQLEEAERVKHPEPDMPDKDPDPQLEQVNEKLDRANEIAMRQLEAQLETDRASHELELELQRQANRRAVRTETVARFSDVAGQRDEQPAPQIRIINVNDPNAVEAQLHTEANERAVLNFLRTNGPEVQEYVNQ